MKIVVERGPKLVSEAEVRPGEVCIYMNTAYLCVAEDHGVSFVNLDTHLAHAHIGSIEGAKVELVDATLHLRRNP